MKKTFGELLHEVKWDDIYDFYVDKGLPAGKIYEISELFIRLRGSRPGLNSLKIEIDAYFNECNEPDMLYGKSLLEDGPYFGEDLDLSFWPWGDWLSFNVSKNILSLLSNIEVVSYGLVEMVLWGSDDLGHLARDIDIELEGYDISSAVDVAVKSLEETSERNNKVVFL